MRMEKPSPACRQGAGTGGNQATRYTLTIYSSGGRHRGQAADQIYVHNLQAGGRHRGQAGDQVYVHNQQAGGRHRGQAGDQVYVHNI